MGPFSVESQAPVHLVGLEGLIVRQNQTVNAIDDPNEKNQRKTLLCSRRQGF